MSESAENIDPTRARGVHNPRVVDLISRPSETGPVRLVMMEFRNWSEDPEQLQQLEEKFNNYLDYVLDGHFMAQYPQYQEKTVEVVLECVARPEGAVQSLIEAMRRYVTQFGSRLSFSVRVNPELSEE